VTDDLDARLRTTLRAADLPAAPAAFVEHLEDLLRVDPVPVARHSALPLAPILAASIVVAVIGAMVLTTAPNVGPGHDAIAPAGSGLPTASTMISPRPTTTVRPGSPVVEPGSLVRVDAATGDVFDVIDVGEHPALVTIAGGHVWTLDFGDGSLSMVDPERRTVEARIAFDDGAAAMVADREDLWVAADEHDLVLLDGRTGAEMSRIQLSDEPLFRTRDAGFVAVTDDALWVTVPKLGFPSQPHELWRVDPQSGTIVARLPLGRDPHPPVVSGGALYIVSVTDETLTRVAAQTDRTTIVPVGRHPYWIAAGAGAVWVGHELGKVIWRMDPDSLARNAVIEIGEPVRAMGFGRERMWVVTNTSLVAIDPATNEIIRTTRLVPRPLPRGPAGLVVFGNSIWIAIE
jgi:DNA-binding beta-propeller fold protein YncE